MSEYVYMFTALLLTRCSSNGAATRA